MTKYVFTFHVINAVYLHWILEIVSCFSSHKGLLHWLRGGQAYNYHMIIEKIYI